MKMKKVLTMACAMALTAAIAIGGTVAYLTDSKEVKNTFTVGKVNITLDEALVNTDGKPVDTSGAVVQNPADAKRVTANKYKLMPGHTYTKDPTVTVLKGSEESYVRMFVTITVGDNFDEQFPNGIKLDSTIVGGRSNKWVLQNNAKHEGQVYTYEFRYEGTVTAEEKKDEVLEALFQTLTVPGDFNNAQLAALNALEIDVTAQAIQADGFEADTDKGLTAEDVAWAAFGG